MELIVFLWFLGLIVGFISAFFGIGGGTLMVPTLQWLFPDMPMKMIIATSLMGIFINSITFLGKSKNEYTLPREHIKWLIIYSLIGAQIGNFILPHVSDVTLQYLFIALLVVTIVRLIFEKMMNPKRLMQTSNTKIAFIALCGGIVSALTGLGGGIVIIPLLLILTSVDLKLINYYSHLSMIFSALNGIINHSFEKVAYNPDFLPDLVLGSHHIGIIMIMQLGIIISTPIGIKLNSGTSADSKRTSLIILLILITLEMFLKAI
jgi:uncharacterized membrane protein YfcA